MNAQSIDADWIVYDQIDDVKEKIQGKSPPYPFGNFHDEIDIEKIELIDKQFYLTFQDKPIKDFNYSYSLTVFWNDENIELDVWTFAKFDHSTNIIETVHTDENDNIILDGQQEDTITILENSLLVPIVNYSLIEEPFSPFIYISVFSSYIVNRTLNYEDNLDDYNIIRTTSQVGKEIPIMSIIVIVMFNIFHLKKKKNK